MRDKNDPGSAEMFPGTKRPRGRPRVEKPLTPAERAARYRQRKESESTEAMAELARQVKELKKALRVATKIPTKRVVTKKT